MKYRAQCPVCRRAVKDFICYTEPDVLMPGDDWIVTSDCPMMGAEDKCIAEYRGTKRAEFDICPHCETAFS